MNSNTLSKPLSIRGDIALIDLKEISYYQRSDGFFCLSDACRQVNKKPLDFLRQVDAVLIFLSSSARSFGEIKLTLNLLLNYYPELIQRERCSGSESGIWLHPSFIDSFQRWSQKMIVEGWHLFCDESVPKENMLSMPFSISSFLISKPKCVRRIVVREADGFIWSSDLYNAPQDIKAILTELKFISALSEVARRRHLSPAQTFSSEGLSPSELVYRQYQSLLDLSYTRKHTWLWVDPQVALLYDANDTQLQSVINDWHQRQKHPNRLAITQLSAGNFSRSATTSPILEFQGFNNCLSIYETESQIFLKVTQKSYRWQFMLDLLNGNIHFPEGLLSWWSCDRDGVLPTFDIDYFLAEAELSRAQGGKSALSRILDNTVVNTWFLHDDDEWELNRHGKVERFILPEDFLASANHIFEVYNRYLVSKSNIDDLRLELRKLGYNSPLEIDSVGKSLSTVIAPQSSDLLSWQVNGVTIRQRADGKIDGTALCRAYGKRIRNNIT